MRERYHSAEALQLYLRLEAREHAQGDSWERELAMAAFEGRDYPDAVRRMEVLSPWEGDPELAFHHALALSRTGDTPRRAI